MKLFELFETSPLKSVDNLSKIAEAVKNQTTAKLMVGESYITISYNTSKYIFDLYESARISGNVEQFMKTLAEGSDPIMENKETLEHIISRFPKEVKDFKTFGALDQELYHALFDYYNLHGEMPYAVAKARSGDPYEWVADKFDNDVFDYNTMDEADYSMEDIYDADSSSMFESKKANKKMEEAKDDDWWGWDEPKKTAHGGTVTKTSSGTVHTGKYGTEYQGDDDDDDDTPKFKKKPKIDGEGKPVEKRGRGRPRTRPLPDENAPKRGRGRPRTRPLPDENAPKRGRGRPKKVREWIESLRYIAESTK